MKCPKCGRGMLARVKEDIIVRGIKLAEKLEVEKCSRCGEVVLTMDQVSKLRAAAERAGIWGYGIRIRRKITVIGKKPALYIPSDIERMLGLKKGSIVEIRTTENKMIVEKVKD